MLLNTAAGIFVARLEDGDLSEARAWAALSLAIRCAEHEGTPGARAVLDEIEAEITGRKIVRRCKTCSAPFPRPDRAARSELTARHAADRGTTTHQRQ